MNTTVAVDEVYRILYNDHHDPFTVLGAHLLNRKGKPSAVVVRAFLPGAIDAWVTEEIAGGKAKESRMVRVHPDGFFELVFEDRSEVFAYMLKKSMEDGTTTVFHDSYAFLPTLSEMDLYLFNAGNHHKIYDKLGAHYAVVNGIGGVQFAVWAPSARSVSVIGDFNGWDRRFHAMRSLGSSGIWEIFIPGLLEGELYKYEVKGPNGNYHDKSDPYAVEMEVRPRTASKVNFLTGHEWHDQEWLERERSEDLLRKPIAVYEVHLGSWRKTEENGWLTYMDLARELATYVLEMGYTHVEFMPVMEHPLDASWGYQVTGYFAPTSRFGRPQEFMGLVDYLHQRNIGVILDWVPAHFPKDSHALGYFDGSHLYEHSDPRQGEHQDWGTFIFNFGRNEVKNFLISNALFWLEKYHIDGLRIDAVASMLYLDYSRKDGEWIPNKYGGRENLDAIEFLKYLNSIVHEYAPGVMMIAEESTAWPGVSHKLDQGGLGFDLKWNMGWMHDMIEYFSKDPVHRKHHQGSLTFALLYAFNEKFILPFSHDEVVHGKGSMIGKMPGDDWQKFSNLRLLLGLMYAFPGKKLLFMGIDFAQWNEWSHESSLDWHLLQFAPHRGLQQWVKDLNALYRATPELHQVDFQYTGFEWIDFQDSANSVISFERKSEDGKRIICVFNCTPVPRQGYRIGVHDSGGYREILNSDAALYGGSNMGNSGYVYTEPHPFHGRNFSLWITLPPLSALLFRHE
ncbi:MAG: 1,4-alpha-glucan branching protein GlgB [Bacteroidota bacterium]